MTVIKRSINTKAYSLGIQAGLGQEGIAARATTIVLELE